MSSIARLTLGSVVIAFAMASLACSSSDARAPGVAGGGGAPMPLVGNEGPCVDGDTTACSVELGRHDGVVSCFSGSRVCVDGTWAACGASDNGTSSIETKRLVTASDGESRTESDAAPGMGTKSLSEASRLAGICASNPCDATCKSFDERPAAVYTGIPVVSSWYENNGDFGGSPPGFISKLVKNPCSSPIDCGFDMHCDLPTRKCLKNAPGWTYSKAECGAIDVTVGAACLVNNRTTLPICNRGNVPIASGRTIRLGLKNGDWIRQPECPAISASTTNCDHVLAKPLYPGACVQVDTCGWSGNAVAFANINVAIAECPGVTGELGCSDNWTDVKVVPCYPVSTTNYEPVTFTEQYIATCPVSTRPSWQFLTYDATTPSNTTGAGRVSFEAQTAPVAGDGSVGTYSALVSAADTAAGDPAVCQVSGPSPCPKALYAALGGSPLAHQRALRLKISLTPTPDQTMTPSLRSWQVSYACVPTE